jgi:cell fate regulator YaaT (PSP1 superfamily)
MPQTVEVRFKGTRREFYTWADDEQPLRLQEAVVVQLERGSDLGRVQTTGATAEKKCGSCASCATGEQMETAKAGGTTVARSDEAETGPSGPAITEGDSTDDTSVARPANPALRSILRRATQEDLKQSNELRAQEEEVRRAVVQKVRQHKLEMKVSDAEWQWDRAKLTVYFTAEKRVDFRALVRELASQFRTRIELRQIGVRDEAARLTGVGRCGREYCCSTWLTDLSPVSLALAKDQHLSLNPSQISGGCGRLLCCLRYEHEFYVTSRKRYPREGKTLATRNGVEKVIAVDIFRERVFLRGEEGSRIIPLVQLQEEMASPEAAAVAVAAPVSAPARHPDRNEGARPPEERRRPEARRPESRPARPGNPRPPRPEAPRPPRPDAPRPDAPSRDAAELPLAAPDDTPSRDAAELPRAAGDDTPSRDGTESQKRRRRRGRRGRGGSGNKPQSPPSPPEA